MMSRKRNNFKCTRTGIEADTMQELFELLQLEILTLREALAQKDNLE